MKKVISSLFVGALGGAFALVGNYYFNQNNTSQVTNYNPYATPTQLASYNSFATAANTPDFVMSAEKTVNSVVHIKTIVVHINDCFVLVKTRETRPVRPDFEQRFDSKTGTV